VVTLLARQRTNVGGANRKVTLVQLEALSSAEKAKRKWEGATELCVSMKVKDLQYARGAVPSQLRNVPAEIVAAQVQHFQ
jgi:hypothetical protein